MFGMIVERAIPSDVWMGLVAGRYKLYGGVIRWAADTAKAGQIVRHLVPVSNPVDSITGIINTYQLHQISGTIDTVAKATQQVLNVATGAMVLSGLSLAVSSIGFVFLNKKLKRLEGKLTEIQQQIYEIRELLELSERAQLRAALRDLLKISDSTNPEHKHTILHNTRQTLAQINEKYRELLSGAQKIETAAAYEEFFCLTALTQCRCTAELGMIDIALQEIEEMNKFWKKEARRIADELIMGKNPERYLFSDFVQNVPVSNLVEWLDFIHDENKGYDWIDELRNKTKSWYSSGSSATSWLPPIITAKTDSEIVLKKEKDIKIPTMQKLVARNNVFEGHITQYELMAKNNITPSAFEHRIAEMAKESTRGYIILKPDKPI